MWLTISDGKSGSVEMGNSAHRTAGESFGSTGCVKSRRLEWSSGPGAEWVKSPSFGSGCLQGCAVREIPHSPEGIGDGADWAKTPVDFRYLCLIILVGQDRSERPRRP